MIVGEADFTDEGCAVACDRAFLAFEKTPLFEQQLHFCPLQLREPPQIERGDSHQELLRYAEQATEFGLPHPGLPFVNFVVLRASNRPQSKATMRIKDAVSGSASASSTACAPIAPNRRV